MIKNDDKHLLFIEPKRAPSAQPVIDDLTRQLTAAWRKQRLGSSRYRGVHGNACDPGVYSDNTDHFVGHGPELMTHSLCIRYLAHFRGEVPAAEIDKVRALPQEYADPTADELAGRAPVADRRASVSRSAQDDVRAALDAAGPGDLVIGGRGDGLVTLPADGLTDADRRVAERLADLPQEEMPPGAEDRAVDRARSAGLFGPPAPASPDSADAGCPACGMSGWTPEQAERFAPRYMAALRSVPSHPIPEQPAAECWDCRRLRAGGHDPAALAQRDLAECGTPCAPREAAS